MPPSRSAPLDSTLRLEFAYGYRGSRCRNNLFYGPSGDTVITHTAAAGVIYDKRTHTQRFFLGHDDDIISLAVAADGRAVATGQVASQRQRMPSICVWDAESAEEKAVLQGFHTRGVCALAFSADTKHLASVGLDDHNSIAIYDWKNRGKLVCDSRGHSDRIFEIEFCPNDSASGGSTGAASSLVTVGVKHVKFWDFSGTALKGRRGKFGKAPIQTMLSIAFSSRGDALTGALNGDVYMWSSGSVSQVISGAHKGPCYTIASDPARGYVTVGKDGKVRMWDTEFRPTKSIDLGGHTMANGAPPCARSLEWAAGEKILIGTKTSDILEIDERTNQVNHMLTGHDEGELWGLAVHPSAPCFATASDDETVRVWDMEKRRQLACRNIGKAMRSIDYSPDGQKLAVGLENGGFMILHAQSLKEEFKDRDRKEAIHEIKFSPDGRRLAVGSHDNFIDVYDVQANYRRIGVGRGHSSYITHIDWSDDSRMMRSNSGDYETLYWDDSGKRITPRRAEVAKMHFATNTCVLGADVKGIWPKGGDKTDINTACQSHMGSLFATGDDDGLVKLFAYPCNKKRSRFKRFRGHSEHVCQVRFACDDRRLITVGGGDQTILQWTFGDSSGNSSESDSDDSDSSDQDSAIERETARPPRSKLDSAPPERVAAKAAKRPAAAVKVDASGKAQRPANAPPPRTRAAPTTRAATRAPAAARGAAARGTGVSASATPDADSSKPISSKPPHKLRLDFIHGYRGYDARSNLYATHAGCIAYPAGGVCVLYDPETHTQRHFRKHTDDVISLTMAPSKTIAASGEVGKSPKIFVWDCSGKGGPSSSSSAKGSLNGECKMLSALEGGHDRGVCALAFSACGTLLASVGLDDKHTMVIWEWKEGKAVFSQQTHQDHVFGAIFNPAAEKGEPAVVTYGVKHIKFWRSSGNILKSTKGTFGKGRGTHTILDAEFDPSSPGTLFAGSSKGAVLEFRGTSCTRIIEGAHKKCIAALQLLPSPPGSNSAPGFVTGSNDGSVSVWSAGFAEKVKSHVLASARVEGAAADTSAVRTIATLPGSAGTVVAGLRNCDIVEVDLKSGSARPYIYAHSEGELWGIDTHPSKRVYVTGSDDQTVRVWDVPSNRVLAVKGVGAPVRSVGYSPDGELVAAGLKSGAVRILSSATLEEVAAFKHRKESISVVRFSPDGSLLAVGSHDNFVDLYRVVGKKSADGGKTGKPFKRVGICKGSSSYITHVDWSLDGRMLQTNSGAYEHLFYSSRGKRITPRRAEVAKIEWASWTCTVGAPVAGIFPKGSDGTDVNSCDLSKSKTHLATADDFGDVNLFKWPADKPNLKPKTYEGHSSHVTGVKFLCDDSTLISIGGNDMCVFQWRSTETKPRSAAARARSGMATSASGDTSSDSESSDSDADEIDPHNGDKELANDLREDFAPKAAIAAASTEAKRAKQAQQNGRAYSATATRAIEAAQLASALPGVPATVAKAAEAHAKTLALATGDIKPTYVDPSKPTPRESEIYAATFVDPSAVPRVGSSGLGVGSDADPREELVLEHVHGFRSFDCTNNIVSLPSGDIAFPAANLAVVYDPSTHTQRFFDSHDDDIISICASSAGDMVATGQIGDDPKVIVWDSTTLAVLAEFHGHHEVGVSALAFSCGASGGKTTLSPERGRYLATAGMDEAHTIVVYDWRENHTVATAATGGGKILDIEFSPYTGGFVSVGVKHVTFWNVVGNTIVGKPGLFSDVGKKQHMLSVAFSPKHTYTGTASGSIYEWTGHRVTRVIDAHVGPVNSLVSDSAGEGFISGGKDGRVRSWDGSLAPLKTFQIPSKSTVGSGAICCVDPSMTNNTVIVGTRRGEIYRLHDSGKLQLLSQGHALGEITGLAVHPDPSIPTYITASSDGSIRLWDIVNKKMLRMRANGSETNWPICARFSPSGEYVAVGYSGGGFEVYISATLDIIGGRRQSSHPVRSIAWAPDGSCLAVGKDSAVIDIYTSVFDPKTTQVAPQQPKRIGRAEGCAGPVVNLDWSDDGGAISADIEGGIVQYFTATGTPLPVTDALRNARWIQRSSIYGPNTSGIWVPGRQHGGDGGNAHAGGIDFGHINAASVSKSGKLLVVGNDDGDIVLHNYPAKKPMSKTPTAYGGHSACVQNVAFAADDHYVISIGGEDMCVMQWCVKTSSGSSTMKRVRAGQAKKTESAFSVSTSPAAVTIPSAKSPQKSTSPAAAPGGRQTYSGASNTISARPGSAPRGGSSDANHDGKKYHPRA